MEILVFIIVLLAGLNIGCGMTIAGLSFQEAAIMTLKGLGFLSGIVLIALAASSFVGLFTS